MTGAAPAAFSFADLILHHALTRPEKPAIVLADRVVTYGMAAQAMTRIERRIRALGLAPGSLVCVTLDSPIRHLIVAAALFRCGHPMMSVVQARNVVPLALPVAAFVEAPGAVVVPGQRQIIAGDDWFDGGAEAPLPASPRGFAAVAICRVELSSGTTGRPKAVSLTLAAFNHWLANYGHSVGQGHWDRLLCLPGLTNSWGFTLAAHVLFAGKTLFAANTARGALQMISLYDIDYLVASSQQLRDMCREQTAAPIPIPSLRGAMTGGSLVSQALILEARAKICSTIVCQYGSTEAGATAFAPAERLMGIEGASGYVAPWAVVEAVDGEDRALPPDTEGTLQIHATCLGQPYPPDRTDAQSNFRNGWFYPGDSGRVRADGLLIVSGRASELINAGGLKVAPELIDEMLSTHPAVAEAAAFGAVGGVGIEEIMVAIVPRGTFNDRQIVAWCAERNVPVARIFRVEAIPRTTLGKVNRDLLRQLAVR